MRFDKKVKIYDINRQLLEEVYANRSYLTPSDNRNYLGDLRAEGVRLTIRGEHAHHSGYFICEDIIYKIHFAQHLNRKTAIFGGRNHGERLHDFS